MSSPLRRHRRTSARVVAVIGVMAVLSGCVHGRSPGVAVKQLSADIVFGVPPEKPDAAPPGVAPPSGLDQALAPPELPPVTKTRATVPKPAASPCPEASESASAAVAATSSVKDPPALGTYRWKASQTKDNKTKTGFFQRSITYVSPVTSAPNPEHDVDSSQPEEVKTFTYDVTTLNADGTKRVTTFRVKTGAVNALVDLPVGNTPAATGESDRGLSLVRIVDYNVGGTEVSSFNPQPAVLLLPLAVAVNQTFQSVGVDAGGASLVHSGTVSSRKTVDACGDIVDGWEVDSNETFTDSSGAATSSSYVYYVATQLGGILTYEKIGPPSGTAAGTTVPDAVTELTLGQLKPTPLPAGAR